ncbi:MAG TPA: NAD(P)/FAD-dependent oxidoreductase [Polyangiaceae bacterium]|jgi:NADH dehydrogenase|nr:NAD(P)/FAD-dependent oxidoreductase [Polyangiaceae bacterium]
MESTKTPRVVVIGAGFAGLAAARALGAADCSVSVIDRRNHHLFQPLLYQVAMAGLSPAEIAQPIRGILAPQKNTEVILGEVQAIDLQAHQVKGTFGALSFDALVVATGAQHSYFGNEAWENFAPGLKTIEQATEIRRRVLCAFEAAERATDPAEIAAWLTFAVVGAGPTGVELAGAIGEMSRHTLARDFRHIDPKATRVLLIEAGPRILPTFSPKLSARAAADLAELGVEVLTQHKVTRIDQNGVTLDLKFIPARTTLWAAGVQASPVAKQLTGAAGLDRQGRAIVEPTLNLASHPEVFVIGDVAHAPDGKGGALPGLAPIAKQQGTYVGKLLAKRLRATGKFSALPNEAPYVYFDKGTMATIGRGKAIAQIGSLELSGLIAWLMWLFIHILYLVGFKNRLLVLIQWIYGYLRFARGARLIVDREWRSFARPKDEAVELTQAAKTPSGVG